MQKITKEEIRWLVSDLEQRVMRMDDVIAHTDDENWRYILQTKRDGYKNLADKLERVALTGDRRIEVTKW